MTQLHEHQQQLNEKKYKFKKVSQETFYFFFNFIWQVVKFLSSLYKPYNKIITQTIFNSNHPYGKFLEKKSINIDAHKGISRDDQQHKLPDIIAEINPQMKPTLSEPETDPKL